MIKAVSGISFKNDATKDINALINSPGKYSAANASTSQAPQGDRADISSSKNNEEKSNTGLVIGGTLAALAAIWVGLGIAVSKGKLADWKIESPDGWGAKLKNFVYSVGESAKKAYDNTLGKWFGKKADDAADATKGKTDKPKTGDADKGADPKPEVKKGDEPKPDEPKGGEGSAA